MLEMLCGVLTYLNKEVISSNHVKPFSVSPSIF